MNPRCWPWTVRGAGKLRKDHHSQRRKKEKCILVYCSDSSLRCNTGNPGTIRSGWSFRWPVDRKERCKVALYCFVCNTTLLAMYSVELFANAKRKTEVVDCNHCAELVIEDVSEKVVFLELFDQSVVFIVEVGAVGHQRRVLNILVICGIGSCDFEWMVVEVVRRGINLRKGWLECRAHHTDDGRLLTRYLLKSLCDTSCVLVISRSSRNESNGAERESVYSDHQFV